MLILTPMTTLALAIGAAALPVDTVLVDPGDPAAGDPAAGATLAVEQRLAVDPDATQLSRQAIPSFVLPEIVADPPAPAGFGSAADGAELAGMRGGDESVANTIHLNGNVNANSATNVVTGSNTIAGGAFANASGVPMVIQNSGANVLIQNATVINLQLR